MSKLYVVNSSRGFDEHTPAAGVAVPVGCVQWFAGNVVPNGWLMCDGSEVSRTDFKALFDVIGTTYGPTAADKFKLPDLRGRFAQGATVPGDVREAGLPNIEGSHSAPNSSGFMNLQSTSSVSGAIYGEGAIASYQNQSGGAGAYKVFKFDASRSNPIYGASTTVQPPALTLVPIIKAV